MKKKWIRILLAVMLVCLGLAWGACKEDEDSSSHTVTGDMEIVLSDYNLDLEVGETHKLTAKVLHSDGSVNHSAKFEFESEGVLVVSVQSDGTLNALQAGVVSINVRSGELRRTCVVTVDSVGSGNKQVQAEIFAPDTVHIGTESAASVGLTNRGAFLTAVNSGVEWSIEPAGVCDVSEGVLQPKTEGEFTLKATFTHDGVAYTTEKAMRVERMKYYDIGDTSLKFATAKTLSGRDNPNAESITRTLKVVEHDVLDSTKDRTLSTGEYTVTVEKPQVVTAATAGETVTLTAGAVGNTAITVQIGEVAIVVTVEVAKAMAFIEDMDALSLAAVNDEALLAGSYMLTQDIDYAGQVILPIASYNDTSKFMTGYVWKYLLKKAETASGFAVLPREDFFKEDKALSDADMQTAAEKRLPNPQDKRFSGTFDGNGYAIKNGEMLLAYNSASTGIVVYATVFGGVSNGVIENVAFSGIKVMNPDDREKYSVDLLHSYVLVGEELTLIALPRYGATGKDTVNCDTAGIIARSHGKTVVRNVLVDIEYNLNGKNTSGALIIWTTSADVRNCFVNITETSPVHYPRRGLGGLDVKNGNGYRNNISVGCDKSDSNNGANEQGKNGNIWAETIEQLFALNVDRKLENAKTLAQIIDTFDDGIWDFSAFQAEGRSLPSLIGGCSQN